MSIEITGLGDILERLERLERMDGVQAALMAAGKHVKGVVDDYPPETEANKPTNPSGRWYERGYGPRWWVKGGEVSAGYGGKSAQAQRREILGKARKGLIHGRKTSKDLDKQWTIKPLWATAVVVGNNVSYAPFVQDEERQARFHKRRGWPTVQQVARQETEWVVRFVTAYLRRLIGGS